MAFRSVARRLPLAHAWLERTLRNDLEPVMRNAGVNRWLSAVAEDGTMSIDLSFHGISYLGRGSEGSPYCLEALDYSLIGLRLEEEISKLQRLSTYQNPLIASNDSFSLAH